MATGGAAGEALENDAPLRRVTELLDSRLKELFSFGWILLLVAAIPSLALAVLQTPPQFQWIAAWIALCSVVFPLYTYLRIKGILREIEGERRRRNFDDERPERDAIDELYVELRGLIARSAVDPSLNPEVQSRFARLRVLQGKEAEKIRRRLDAGLHLKPGEGYQALENARRLLAEHAHPAAANKPSSR